MCKMIQLECYRRNVEDPALLTVHPVLFQCPDIAASYVFACCPKEDHSPSNAGRTFLRLLNNPIGHQATRAVRMGTLYARSSQVAE